MQAQDSQHDVMTFLRDPASWPGKPDRVDTIETHAAFVFLAGEDVLKVKRAIRLAYLDFTTLDARKRVCERELALNAPHAAGLYHDVIAIVRTADGMLSIGGDGVPVEWAVRMCRFDQSCVLASIAKRKELTSALLKSLADRIFAWHRGAPSLHDAVDHTADVAKVILAALDAAPDVHVRQCASDLRPLLAAALAASAAVRTQRAAAGYIRRCHGDLHLNNIVLWQGQPVPFDALEFDEALATVDILYDLAFLLMDLDRHDARPHANTLLNRYLWRTGDVLDLHGLAAMPVYLGLRAAVRAMVAVDRGAATQTDTSAHVCETLMRAAGYLRPPPPCLVAVGGLSGTGKTTLATALAPTLGAAPGAVHVRTDLERKWLAGVDELERLSPTSYTDKTSRAAYDRVMQRAEVALKAGHAVIVDGVFSSQAERKAMEDLARRRGVAFHGLWLSAPAHTLKARVASRVSDASDATTDVVDRQLAHLPRVTGWAQVDANQPRDLVLLQASRLLQAPPEAAR